MSRLVAQRPRTLLDFDPSCPDWVTLLGTALLVTDSAERR
jgi:hypothetical protein